MPTCALPPAQILSAPNRAAHQILRDLSCEAPSVTVTEELTAKVDASSLFRMEILGAGSASNRDTSPLATWLTLPANYLIPLPSPAFAPLEVIKITRRKIKPTAIIFYDFRCIISSSVYACTNPLKTFLLEIYTPGNIHNRY